MYNWQFDGFIWMNALSAYFCLGERIEHQAELMKMFRQYGAFEGREKGLGFFERGILEQIACEELTGRQMAGAAGRLGKR